MFSFMVKLFLLLLILSNFKCELDNSTTTTKTSECDGISNGYYYLTNNSINILQCKLFLINDPQIVIVEIENNQSKQIYEAWGLGPCSAISENKIFPNEVIKKIEIYIKNNNNLVLKKVFEPTSNDDWVYSYFDDLQKNRFYLIINN